MANPWDSTDEGILHILRGVERIAVVGLSPNPFRPSYGVAVYLQRAGYRITPVNPNYSEVLGEKSYPSLSAIPFPVDIADVFRRPDALPEVIEDAIRADVSRLWFQIGVVNEPAIQRAVEAGIQVVVDRCLKVEHRRLLGSRK